MNSFLSTVCNLGTVRFSSLKFEEFCIIPRNAYAQILRSASEASQRIIIWLFSKRTAKGRGNSFGMYKSVGNSVLKKAW